MTAATAKALSPADLDAQLDAELDAARLANRLRRDGFKLWIEGDKLKVSPFSKLDLLQRQALKAAKAQIIALLKIEAAPAPRPAPQTWQQLPPLPPPVACGDCRHSAAIPDSDPVYGWRTCNLQLGGGLARQDRHCDGFEAAGNVTTITNHDSASNVIDNGSHE